MQGKAKFLIIAPARFEPALASLIRHKNKTDMPTVLVSLESIQKSWQNSDDDPAKIKRTIWTYGRAVPTSVRYVMLVGDMSIIPCRRRTIENLPGNPDALIWRWGYEPTELYYSNLFFRHKIDLAGKIQVDDPSFNTWDLNANGLYDEQHWAGDTVKFNPDQVDGCPDVAIGRIPAHTVGDVENFVAKDIAYEEGPSSLLSDPKITLCFGKTYEESYEMTRDLRDKSGIENRFGPANVTMLGLGYQLPSELPNSAKDNQVGDLSIVESSLQKSLWFGYLGHGSALGWDAHIPDGKGASVALNSRFVKSLTDTAATSRGRLPIIFCCGCETGRHAPGLPRDEFLGLDGKKHWIWWGDKARNAIHKIVDTDTGQFWESQIVVPPPSPYDLPEYQPRNFAVSWLCGSPARGAIAYFGEELICQNDMGRDLESMMLRNLDPHKPGVVLGDVWLAGQQEYWTEYHDYEGDNCVFRTARIYLGIMNLYGDPSLRIR
jgi:hypothetical protein